MTNMACRLKTFINMKISELPQEIKEKALEYQMNACSVWDKETDVLEHAFGWCETKEGPNYWNKLNRKPEPNPILTELIEYAEQNENIYLLNKLKELKNEYLSD